MAPLDILFSALYGHCLSSFPQNYHCHHSSISFLSSYISPISDHFLFIDFLYFYPLLIDWTLQFYTRLHSRHIFLQVFLSFQGQILIYSLIFLVYSLEYYRHYWIRLDTFTITKANKFYFKNARIVYISMMNLVEKPLKTLHYSFNAFSELALIFVRLTIFSSWTRRDADREKLKRRRHEIFAKLYFLFFVFIVQAHIGRAR